MTIDSNVINEENPLDIEGDAVPLPDEAVGEDEEQTVTTAAIIDRSFEARLQRVFIILTNASGGNEEIYTLLNNYGFDEPRFNEGWDLYNTTSDLFDLQKELWAARIGAYGHFSIVMDALEKEYKKDLMIARNLFEGDIGASELLELDGHRETRIAKFISQMRRFFKSALKPELIGTFNENGITEAVLTQWLETAASVSQLYAVYKDARSVAQQSTVARNNALYTVEGWTKKLLVFAQAALRDTDPQLLESLLILVRDQNVNSKDRQKTPPVYPAPPFVIPPTGIIVP